MDSEPKNSAENAAHKPQEQEQGEEAVQLAQRDRAALFTTKNIDALSGYIAAALGLATGIIQLRELPYWALWLFSFTGFFLVVTIVSGSYERGMLSGWLHRHPVLACLLALPITVLFAGVTHWQWQRADAANEIERLQFSDRAGLLTLTPDTRPDLIERLKSGVPPKSVGIVTGQNSAESRRFGRALVAVFDEAGCLLGHQEPWQWGGETYGVLVQHTGEKPGDVPTLIFDVLDEVGIPGLKQVQIPALALGIEALVTIGPIE